MLVLAIRTDNPTAELSLYQDGAVIARDSWHAHRSLAETLHEHILDLLTQREYRLADVQAVAVYRGPGSFTGLRIGLSVANGLALGLDIPIIGAAGTDWAAKAVRQLAAGADDGQVVPEYGAPVHITPARK